MLMLGYQSLVVFAVEQQYMHDTLKLHARGIILIICREGRWQLNSVCREKEPTSMVVACSVGVNDF